MAEIFKGQALDSHGLERPVVIKRILPHIAANPEFVQMLIDEAKIAVMLSHGNIAQIYDLGKVAEDYFIVMEYVEGKTLSQIVKRLRTEGRHLPIAHAIAICIEIAKGLDYMHRKTDERGNLLHIVHRDISPQNIIISTSGTVKIIDFGIAKAKNKISTTDSGVLKGKFAYMSPEHAEGEKLDHRADIFSLGVILFELITDQRLFKGKNNLDTVRKVKRAKVPLPSGIRRGIPKELDEIIVNALQRDRNKRYSSAEDLAQDLNKLLVNYYPEFSPRDLAQFLKELFPEFVPVESSGPETTPSALIIRKQEEKNRKEVEDDTFAADSEMIKLKLKETEVFDVPVKKPVENGVALSDELTTSLKPWHALKKWGAMTLAVLLFIGVGTYVFKHRHKKTTLSNESGQGIKRKEIMNEVFRIQATLKEKLKSETPTKPRQEPEKTALAAPAPQPVSPPPKPQMASGDLSIISNPPGADIFIDDVRSDQKTPALLKQLDTGRAHKVGIFLANYKFWEGSVKTSPDKTTTLSIPLEMNSGDLAINSLPIGAEVYLNGQSVGRTPYQRSRISPGSIYEVTLKYQGYEDWTRSVKVFGGRKEVVNASLKKIPRE